MFRMLIVDDEAIIAKGIKSSVDWTKLGFVRVETAYNMRQAQKSFAIDSFDVMICDIEMPQGTGFDLFAWVREHYPKTECIFLTCHAEFDYAKKAVQLGSLDYLLKPVPSEELEKTVQKALDKVWRERDNAAKLMEKFWKEVLYREIPSRVEFILEHAGRLHLAYTKSTLFLPVLLHFNYWDKELVARDEIIMLYALRKAMVELILCHFDGSHVIQLSQEDFVLIIPLVPHADHKVEETQSALKAYCADFIHACNTYFYAHFSSYIGKHVPIDGLADMYEKLDEARNNQVNTADRVFLYDEISRQECTMKIPDMQVWSEMLRKLEKNRLLGEIHMNFASWKAGDQLNRKQLQLFYQGFLQVVLHTLQQTGLRAEEILHEHLMPERTLASTRSLRELQHWVTEVIEIAVARMKALDSNETTVEKIKRYIELNLDAELSRQYIADHVGLSPDYVVKVFKKEMGMSISDYILQKRLSRAKELLILSEMSISDVALSVGYSNFSYFSTLFRKETSMTPQDYRKQHT